MSSTPTAIYWSPSPCGLTIWTRRPNDLFRRNCWISFEPVEGSLKVLAEYIRPHEILWATDYPHRDGLFPGAPPVRWGSTA
jgi:hypothetical protein